MLIKIVFDFSYVLLFAKDKSYSGKLNDLNDKLSSESDYEPLNYFEVNTELIEFLSQYKEQYSFYIFTAGKMHKLPSLKSILEKVFTNFLSEADVGLPKNNPQAFIKLSEMVNANVSEILFIDDKYENVDAARKAGLQTLQYVSNEQLSNELKTIL